MMNLVDDAPLASLKGPLYGIRRNLESAGMLSLRLE
jgi:hypothetical protein